MEFNEELYIIKKDIDTYIRNYNIELLIDLNIHKEIFKSLDIDVEFRVDVEYIENKYQTNNAIFIYSKSKERLIGEINIKGCKLWLEKDYIDNHIDKESFYKYFLASMYFLKRCDIHKYTKEIVLENKIYQYKECKLNKLDV